MTAPVVGPLGAQCFRRKERCRRRDGPRLGGGCRELTDPEARDAGCGLRTRFGSLSPMCPALAMRGAPEGLVRIVCGVEERSVVTHGNELG
eukprot:1774592-Alexandrium_andersonii.AAC.1